LDELQAAILDVKLRHLPAWLARRRAVAACYDRYLDPSIVRPRIADGTRHSYHLYVIESERRASIIERLKAEEIGFGIHYPKPLHWMPGFQAAAVVQPSLPITERMASCILSLPCYPELSLEAVQKTCSIVNDAHHQKRRD
jgi:dTDP-4-amino-4,6-dideoxygalactose transaminase